MYTFTVALVRRSRDERIQWLCFAIPAPIATTLACVYDIQHLPTHLSVDARGSALANFVEEGEEGYLGVATVAADCAAPLRYLQRFTKPLAHELA